MTTTTKEVFSHLRVDIENLVFAHWQYSANEKVYANRLITKKMYEFAREELRKSIDRLSKKCYGINNKVDDDKGFINNSVTIG